VWKIGGTLKGLKIITKNSNLKDEGNAAVLSSDLIIDCCMDGNILVELIVYLLQEHMVVVIRMIKSRKIRLPGHVTRMGGEEECMWDIG
jgi:hypothetical protein